MQRITRRGGQDAAAEMEQKDRRTHTHTHKLTCRQFGTRDHSKAAVGSLETKFLKKQSLQKRRGSGN